MVGQVRTAMHAAVASVTIVQVGLKGFGFGQPHHCGGGHKRERTHRRVVKNQTVPTGRCWGGVPRNPEREGSYENRNS